MYLFVLYMKSLCWVILFHWMSVSIGNLVCYVMLEFSNLSREIVLYEYTSYSPRTLYINQKAATPFLLNHNVTMISVQMNSFAYFTRQLGRSLGDILAKWLVSARNNSVWVYILWQPEMNGIITVSLWLPRTLSWFSARSFTLCYFRSFQLNTEHICYIWLKTTRRSALKARLYRWSSSTGLTPHLSCGDKTVRINLQHRRYNPLFARACVCLLNLNCKGQYVVLCGS